MTAIKHGLLGNTEHDRKVAIGRVRVKVSRVVANAEEINFDALTLHRAIALERKLDDLQDVMRAVIK